MPDWVSNHLTLIGQKSQLESFITFVGEKGVKGTDGVWRYSILNSFFSTPEEFNWNSSEFRTELVMKYGVRSAEEWNFIHWGTKWPDNIGEKGFVWQIPTRVLVCFDTIGNPPIIGLQAISKFYSLLEFRLHCSYESNRFHPFSCTIESGQIYNQKMSPKSKPVEEIKDQDLQKIEEQEIVLDMKGKSNEQSNQSQ